jgi:WD40 repeat protein
LPDHERAVECVAFSPDGKQIASGSRDMTICVWEVESGRLLRRIVTHQTRKQVLPPPKTLKEWTQLYRRQRNMTKEQIAKYAKMFADIDRLQAQSGYSGIVSGIEFSPSGKSMVAILTRGSLTQVAIYDADTGKVVTTLDLYVSAALAHAAGGPAGGRAAGQFGGDLGGGSVSGTQARWIAFWPGEERFSVGNVLAQVKSWDTTGKLLGEMKRVHHGAIGAITVVPAGPQNQLAEPHLATADRTGTIRIFDGRGKLVKSWVPDRLGDDKGWSGLEPIPCMRATPDGRLLVTSRMDQRDDIYDVTQDWKLVASLRDRRAAGRCIAVSSDGRTVANPGPRGPIKLWDVATQKEIGELLGHTEPVNALCFSPDGKILASGSDDHTVKLWDWQSAVTR